MNATWKRTVWAGGLASLGMMVALGCSHANRRQGPMMGHPPMMVVMDAPSAVPVRPTALPDLGPSKIEQMALKEDDLSEPVAITVVSPDGRGGSVAGTMEVSSLQAKRMGIRPGVTPGALVFTKPAGESEIVPVGSSLIVPDNE